MHDIVIVGAGITGASSAYLLSRAGLRVTLIERADLSGQASANNPGGINPLHGPGIPGPLLDFSLHCHALHRRQWDDVRELTGRDFAPRLVTRLEVALDAADAAALNKSAQLYRDTPGFDAEFLDTASAHRLEPGLAPDIHSVLALRGNALVDSAAYTLALLDAARQLGATLLHDEVTGLVTHGDRVTGVRLAKDMLPCGQVLIATGPWAGACVDWLGVKIPVRPVKGQLLRMRLAVQPAPAHHVLRHMMGLYCHASGDVILGGTQEDVGFDGTSTVAAEQTIMATAARLYPAIRQARLLDRLVAFRPVAADNYPVVGRLPGWHNAFVATGGGTKGVLFSAGIAQLVHDLLCNDIEGPAIFSPSRFSNQ